MDYIAKTASSTTVAYPLYDAHGNMIATVDTSGTLGDGRYYDAWGNVIGSGSATGDPKGRYCANLGHVQDDESGLIYMRARYYEPGTGRFASEDRSHADRNWYVYASNCPSNFVDNSGCDSGAEWRQLMRLVAAAGGGAMLINAYFAAFNATGAITPAQLTIAYDQSLQAVAVIGLAMVYSTGVLSRNLDLAFALALTGAVFAWIGAAVTEAAVAGKSFARISVAACFGYSLVIAGFLLADIIENTL